MKKGNIIFISVVSVVVLTALIGFINDSRIYEKPLNQVIQIAENKGGKDYAMFPLAYSIEKNKDKIIVTLYGNLETVKSIHEFSIVDNKISSENIEIHFEKKIYAKKYFFDNSYDYLNNKKLKGNIISGTLNTSVGKDADTLIETLDETYSNFLEKIQY